MSKKKSKKKSKKSKKSSKKSKSKSKNINISWKAISGALLVLFILSIGAILAGLGCTGDFLGSEEQSNIQEASVEEVEVKVNDFLESQVPDGSVDLESVEKEDGLYKFTVMYQGQETPLYTTLDGENLVQGVTSFETVEEQQTQDQEDQDTQSEDIPKSDEPTVDLYVMSFCSYGNQAENTMESVYDLLKDKVDFNVEYIVDVNGEEVQSLHGQKEVDQNMREACVLEEYSMDKWWEFTTYVNDNCGSKGECWETAAQETGLSADKISSCVDERGLELMKASAQSAKEAGASGSPTLKINGQKSEAVYEYGNSDAYKEAICSAFNNPPSECEDSLSGSSSSSAPSGGSC